MHILAKRPLTWKTLLPHLHFCPFSFFHIFIFVAIKWYKSDNESCEGDDTEDPDVDFEQLVNQAEEEEDEDWGLPLERPRRLQVWISKLIKNCKTY